MPLQLKKPHEYQCDDNARCNARHVVQRSEELDAAYLRIKNNRKDQSKHSLKECDYDREGYRVPECLPN